MEVRPGATGEPGGPQAWKCICTLGESWVHFWLLKRMLWGSLVSGFEEFHRKNFFWRGGGGEEKHFLVLCGKMHIPE